MQFDVAHLGDALSPVEQDLRDRLAEYEHVIRSLTASPLFGPGSVGLQLTPRDDGQFDVGAQAPVDWEGLRGAMTYFRRAWLNDERTCFTRLRSQIRANAMALAGPYSVELVEWLDALGKEHSRARRELPDMMVLEARTKDGAIVDERSASAERIIEDWFNGEIFHGDLQRRERLDAAGDPDAYVFALMIAVQNVTRVYVPLAWLANAILAEPALRPSASPGPSSRG
jgi:hypothetical protein